MYIYIYHISLLKLWGTSYRGDKPVYTCQLYLKTSTSLVFWGSYVIRLSKSDAKTTELWFFAMHFDSGYIGIGIPLAEISGVQNLSRLF